MWQNPLRVVSITPSLRRRILIVLLHNILVRRKDPSSTVNKIDLMIMLTTWSIRADFWEDVEAHLPRERIVQSCIQEHGVR
jgi:hypothetical protein